MELDMENNDATKGRDIALHSAENGKTINVPCEQALEDDLALFVNQFRMIFNNKGMEIKKVGESSRISNHQSHGKFNFG
ncbi:hypothetical protein ACFX1S_007113 [Malus domestica]